MRSTGLLQVVLSDLSRLVVHKLAASCYNNLQQVCKYQVAASLILQTCCNLMKSTDLLQLVDNLQQVGKIHNLQQVCGVSGCVRLCMIEPCLHSQKRASCSKSAADLLQLAIIKPISGCVRIACSGLMTTSLLQVVNRLAASCELQTCCKL